MHVVVALPPKETPQQCTNCGEWSHRGENCAKNPRCFTCSSTKHRTENHICCEEECSDGIQRCPHPTKCIVCGGPHMADNNTCPLRPTFSKAKGVIKRPDRDESLRIRGQQKIIRNRHTREN